MGHLWMGDVMAAPSASTDEGARELFLHGQQLYQEGRYRDALVAFDVAYRMSQRAAILRSIAYCHEKLGELDQSLVILRRYRGLAPEEKWDGIDRAIVRIENEKTAAIQRAEQKAEEEALAAQQAEQLREPEPEPEPEPAPDPVYDPAPTWRVGKGSIVLYSVGGVAAGLGGFFALSANKARSYARQQCTSGGLVYCPVSAEVHIREDRVYSNIADGGFGLASAAILGATVWMVVDNKQTQGVSIRPSLQGIHMQGRF